MRRKYIVSLSAFAAIIAVLLSISVLNASTPAAGLRQISADQVVQYCQSKEFEVEPRASRTSKDLSYIDCSSSDSNLGVEVMLYREQDVVSVNTIVAGVSADIKDGLPPIQVQFLREVSQIVLPGWGEGMAWIEDSIPGVLNQMKTAANRFGMVEAKWQRFGITLAGAITKGEYSIGFDIIDHDVALVAFASPTPTPTRTPLPTRTSRPTPMPKVITVTVVSVVDGDTIDVQLPDGTTKRLRYIGVNTPESVDPNSPVQCFGPEASAYNKQLVEGQTVRIEKDVSEVDKYGRLLRYVYLADGRMVNEELVKAGYAQVSTYPPDVKYSRRFLTAQQAARKASAGLWGACVATPTAPPAPKATVTPVPQEPEQGSAPCNCSGPDLDCKDFSTQADAQACWAACGGRVGGPNPFRLDGNDKDGLVCESLP